MPNLNIEISEKLRNKIAVRSAQAGVSRKKGVTKTLEGAVKKETAEELRCCE